MARIDISYAKSLYFCGVKNHMRHDVAGSASFFRATNLVEKLYPNDGGSSNARKGLAYDTLTHRIGVLLCLKVMQSNNKQLTDAQQKVVESIQEYLSDFHSVPELYERLAKALSEIMLVSVHMSNEAKETVNNMVQDYICLLDLLDPINEKGGEI